MRHYFLGYFLPGLGLVLLAFWAGAQNNFLFGLAGFLSFFVLGVTLIVEGYKKSKNG